MTIRAKFHCKTETRHSWDLNSRTYEFRAVYDPDLPEDQRYCRATPSGTLEMVVDNPNATFDLGRAYYLDFTPVDEEATPPAGAADHA